MHTHTSEHSPDDTGVTTNANVALKSGPMDRRKDADGAERITLGRMQNPIRGFLHGGASLAALMAIPALVGRAPDTYTAVAAVVFGISLSGLFAVSAMYHSVPWRTKWKQRMQRLDHTMILVVIAGTYTPIMAVLLEREWFVAGMIAVWGAVLIGALQHVLFPRNDQRFSMALAITLGWVGVLLSWLFLVKVGVLGSVLVLGGGVLYTLGVVVLVRKKPVLWERSFSSHELFHVMVVVAAGLHTMAIGRYVF